MVATAIYSVTMVLWKETAFPLCRAMERHWKRNVVSREGVFCSSGDMPANLLCELNGHLILCTSCLYGKWVEDVCAGQQEPLSVDAKPHSFAQVAQRP